MPTNEARNDIAQFNIQIDMQQRRAFDTARHFILGWAESEIERPMKRCAYSGEPFFIRSTDKSLTSMADGPLWALSLKEKDENGLPYVTDVSLRYVGRDKLFLGTKITRCCEAGNKKDLARKVPPFLQQIADRVGLVDAGRKLQAAPVVIDNDKDVHSLFGAIFDPSRTLPVLVVSEHRCAYPRGFEYPMDAALLSRKLYGIATVVQISEYATRHFSPLVPPEWRVQTGSIRYYRPDAKLDQTDVFHAHPYDNLLRVRSVNPQTYANEIHERIVRDSARRPATTQQVRSFRENMSLMQSCGLLGAGL